MFFEQANNPFSVECECDQYCTIGWLVVFIVVGVALLARAIVFFIQGKFFKSKHVFSK